MKQRTQALFGLGGVTLLISAGLGAPWTGYGMGLAPLLFRIGIIYLLLSVVTAQFDPVTLHQAIKGAVGSLAVSFLVGTGTMYYELGMTAPEYATPLTAGRLLRHQAEILLLLAPVPAAYVCAVLFNRNRRARSLLLFACSMFGGWFAAIILTYVAGTMGDFATLYYFFISLGAGVTALPLLKIAICHPHFRETTGRERPTT